MSEICLAVRVPLAPMSYDVRHLRSGRGPRAATLLRMSLQVVRISSVSIGLSSRRAIGMCSRSADFANEVAERPEPVALAWCLRGVNGFRHHQLQVVPGHLGRLARRDPGFKGQEVLARDLRGFGEDLPPSVLARWDLAPSMNRPGAPTVGAA